MNNDLNIERLHSVVSTIINKEIKDRSRGVGYTTGYIQLMVGEVELGDWNNNYLYVGENNSHVRQVKEQFLDIIADTYGTNIITHNTADRCVINGQQFMFKGVDQLLKHCAFRGLRLNRVFVDLCGDTVRWYGEELTEACEAMYLSTIPDGDII